MGPQEIAGILGTVAAAVGGIAAGAGLLLVLHNGMGSLEGADGESWGSSAS